MERHSEGQLHSIDTMHSGDCPLLKDPKQNAPAVYGPGSKGSGVGTGSMGEGLGAEKYYTLNQSGHKISPLFPYKEILAELPEEGL